MTVQTSVPPAPLLAGSASALETGSPTIPEASPLSPYQFKPSPLSSHGRILQFFDSFSREARLLDVGTVWGYLGAALQRRGFRHVCGLEADPQLAAQARPFYEELVVSNQEATTFPWTEGSFDAIICADILEHLREPAAVLRALCRLLAPGGWMVVSLPNVAHWSVRLSLLCGRFTYEPRGIMDRTHLRFYTRATARALVTEAGLAIRREAVTPLPFSTWQQGSSWPWLWQAMERVDVGFARLRPSLFAYQLFFMCQRAEEVG